MDVHSTTTYKKHTIEESGLYDAYGFRVHDQNFIATVNTQAEAKKLVTVLVDAKNKPVKNGLKPTVMLVEQTNGDLTFKFCYQKTMHQYETLPVPNNPFWLGCKNMFMVWQLGL